MRHKTFWNFEPGHYLHAAYDGKMSHRIESGSYKSWLPNARARQQWVKCHQGRDISSSEWPLYPAWLRLKTCNWLMKLPTQRMSFLQETSSQASSLSLWQDKPRYRVCRWRWKGMHMSFCQEGSTRPPTGFLKSNKTWCQKIWRVSQRKVLWAAVICFTLSTPSQNNTMMMVFPLLFIIIFSSFLLLIAAVV